MTTTTTATAKATATTTAAAQLQHQPCLAGSHGVLQADDGAANGDKSGDHLATMPRSVAEAGNVEQQNLFICMSNYMGNRL